MYFQDKTLSTILTIINYISLYYNGLPIFVIAEWATLLVDIRHFSGLAALMSADIARNL